MSDISIFIDNEDVKSIKRKILELEGIIKARNDELNRISNTNKWSVPLSLIGVVLTIISVMFTVIVLIR